MIALISSSKGSFVNSEILIGRRIPDATLGFMEAGTLQTVDAAHGVRE